MLGISSERFQTVKKEQGLIFCPQTWRTRWHQLVCNKLTVHYEFNFLNPIKNRLNRYHITTENLENPLLEKKIHIHTTKLKGNLARPVVLIFQNVFMQDQTTFWWSINITGINIWLQESETNWNDFWGKNERIFLRLKMIYYRKCSFPMKNSDSCTHFLPKLIIFDPKVDLF